MAGSDEQFSDIVVLQGLHSLDSLATAVLTLERIHAHAFDVSEICHGDHNIFSRDQILHGDIKLIIADPCSSVVAIFFGNGKYFFFDHSEKKLAVCEDRLQFLDLFCQFCIFCLDLLSFQTGKSSQTHVHDCLRLHI